MEGVAGFCPEKLYSYGTHFSTCLKGSLPQVQSPKVEGRVKLLKGKKLKEGKTDV